MKHLFKAFLLGILLSSQALGEVYVVPDMAGGLNDVLPGHLIADNEVSQISNFHINPFTRGLEQRRGSSPLNSTQLTGKKAVDLFTYVQEDLDEYIMALSSKTWSYSSDNGTTFTTLITTATDSSIPEGVNFRDKFYWVSQSDGGNSFDGTVQAYISAMPAGKYIQKYQNRLWVANTSANNNRLYFSGLLLPTTWTTSTDYIDFPEPITAIGKPYDGGLPIYTANQTWMLRGSAPSNFYVQQISDVIGCAYNRTIQNFNLSGNSYQIFLSKGQNLTENNIYALNGVAVRPIGNKVLNTLAAISIGNSSERSQVWDSASEFSAGTNSNTSTSAVSGSVVLASNNVDLANNSFETGSGTDADNWSEAGGSNSGRTLSAAQSGSYSMGVSGQGTGACVATTCTPPASQTAKIFDSLGTQLGSTSLSVGGSFSQVTIPMTGYSGKTVYLYFDRTGPNQVGGAGCACGINGSGLQSDNFISNGQDITLYIQKDGTYTYFDNFQSGRNNPQITSGTYTSQVVQADANIARWKTLDATYVTNNGVISFYVKTATSSAMLASASWTSITPGSDISATTNQFMQWKADISSGTATNLQDIHIDRVAVNWTSSSGSSQPLGSAVFDGNYWLTYTGGSQSRNQSILVMNREGSFTTMSGINSYSLAVERGRLFSGDSSTDTTTGGYAWELETGNTDNGTAVTAQVTLKNQQFTLDDYQKNLINAYFNYAVGSSGSFTATILENFSEHSNDYTDYFASGTSYNRFKIEPNQQTTGNHFGLKFTNTSTASRLNLYPPISYYFEKTRFIPQ